jgi:2-polyprenyl-6-methoxyphenol hydroxylase-like FAD-dependent oxidoreductase
MNILISGGGIAGSAAALFLSRHGHDVRVIDRAPSFQKRGYAITLKGFGLELMNELGLDKELAEHSLHLDELHVYESNARPLQVFSRAMTDEITHGMILLYRSELHAVLHDAVCRASIPTRFGLHIEAVEEEGRQARVKLSDGTIEEVDLLVVAEGVRSTTRRLLWADDGVRPFDVVYAAGTVHVDHGLDPRAAHGYLGDAQNVAFMPVGEQDLLIQCYWRASMNTPAPGSLARTRLIDAFRSFAPSVRRLLDAIPEDGDVFCDSISMIDLPTLHRGRTVLLGDAGYCPTFLSGMGASLGLLGAKVLSTALPLSGADLARGLEQYGDAMRPVVEHFHANALQNVGDALPTSHLKSVFRSWILHLLPPSLLARHFRHQFDVEAKVLHGVVSPRLEVPPSP